MIAVFDVVVRLVGLSENAKAARLKGKQLKTLMRHAELLYCATIQRTSLAVRKELAGECPTVLHFYVWWTFL